MFVIDEVIMPNALVRIDKVFGSMSKECDVKIDVCLPKGKSSNLEREMEFSKLCNFSSLLCLKFVNLCSQTSFVAVLSKLG